MPKRIPIETAKSVAQKHDLHQVLLIGWDGALTHVVTYGATPHDCALAAKAQDFWTGKIREFSFRDGDASPWRRDLFVDESEDVGVKLSHFADAIQTYVMMQQGRRVCVRELASVFNTDRRTVLDAIDAGYWLYTTGDGADDTKHFVGVDGE
ncbi:MAG TPA: hypothetical protein VEA80_06750 [Vitreimonas sp.]|uniref:hypothetical protein n=1 Tax=Vitreimonas sp. TaxID=3069702 RepID=UPI002D3BFDC4|nr:hypothetical protein [Vitreimonas sp.]HYD87153.1 hypothetical protein [Vitreimonas sp.]